MKTSKAFSSSVKSSKPTRRQKPPASGEEASEAEPSPNPSQTPESSKGSSEAREQTSERAEGGRWKAGTEKEDKQARGYRAKAKSKHVARVENAGIRPCCLTQFKLRVPSRGSVLRTNLV